MLLSASGAGGVHLQVQVAVSVQELLAAGETLQHSAMWTPGGA